MALQSCLSGHPELIICAKLRSCILKKSFIPEQNFMSVRFYERFAAFRRGANHFYLNPVKSYGLTKLATLGEKIICLLWQPLHSK